MIWQELVKTALIGTERSTLSADLQSHLQSQGIDITADAPQVLLQSAAMYAQLRKAGFVLQNLIGNLPQPALVSEENSCSRISIRHFGQILEGTYKKILPEFIFIAAQANKILPPEYLPLFFQNCQRNKKLWHTALPVIGNRGRWLLQQNPAWKRLFDQMQDAKIEPLTEAEIYPVLENKFQIWGSDDVAFRARPNDFNELRAFWQTVETRTYDNFIHKSLQILLFREEMMNELSKP